MKKQRLSQCWFSLGELKQFLICLKEDTEQKGRYDVACRGVFAKDCVSLAVFLIVLFLTKNLILSLTALAVVYVAAILFIDSHIIGAFGGISFSSTWQRQKGLILEGLPLFINAFLNAYIINASKYALENFYGSEMMGLFSPLYMMAFVVNMFSCFCIKTNSFCFS